ncbi:uracil-DNA glycosylase [Paracoccus liaowanqingii]|uniref:Uracil-DNA glycosylase n=1 Tax=Paracoccus liaowanqingii TaxID=2560053 RepID=A0A4P7HLG9_9RHOB|nr:uracil-DNA glycosylase [Paracoccus liaowanqingii]QBX34473.1 uracil-DNA glycosylase [Paracoccus liaowanqingii]
MIPPEAWAHLPFFTEVWPALRDRLPPDFLPGPDRLFAALEATAPQDTRVVILGQDPYPTPGHANGLAFSVTHQTPLPRSLKNIFTELRDDIGATPATGDLSTWARQGVLLLNSALSVLPGRAGAHARWGWDRLAREAVTEAQRHQPLAFLLWGAHAQKTLRDLPRPQDLVIATAHPSPLSARRGFFGSRPFSRINDWLTAHDARPVDWTG